MVIWSELADWDTCARDGGIAIGEDGVVRLAASHLITHEPGAFSTQHGEELFQHVQAQVHFTLGGTCPERVDCYFFAREEPDNQWPLLVTVNGHTQMVGPGTPLAGEFAWYHVRVPGPWLRSGDNSVCFACESPAALAWILAVDTSVPNAHSRKSADGGQTWHTTGIGLEGALSGEYVVRLRMHEHPAQGVLTSPAIRIESSGQGTETLAETSASLAPHETSAAGESGQAGVGQPLTFLWHVDTPPETEVALRYRSGRQPELEDLPWHEAMEAPIDSSENQSARLRGNDGLARAEIPLVSGPYVQWQAVLTTGDGGATPILRSVALGPTNTGAAEPTRANTLSDVKSKIAPSYAFTHQNPSEPKLAILRRQERLDAIIADAATRWEQMLALRSWVAVQWVHRAPHEFRRCCPWDALTILAWMRADRGHGQPQPDAYCTHYAAVLAQCALALGWPARLWVMSAEPTLHDNGHFVAEIWSIAHNKWVMLDADTDSHVARAGVPLSVLEIHDAWRDDALDRLHVIAGANADKVKIGPDWIEEMLPLGLYRFCGLVLRNNHLSTLIPGPVEHGWTTYKWDGFLWWRNGSEPELAFFSLSSNRRADFDWEPEG